jgi:hypothetical protein
MTAQTWLTTAGIAEIMGLGLARTATLLRRGDIPTAELVDGMWEAERGAVIRFAKTYPYKGTSLHAPDGHPATRRRVAAAAPAPARAARRAARKPSANITAASLELFLLYVRDAPNWSGTPLVGGNVGGTRQDRGNLTQLKRAGLITTTLDEGHTWIYFTAEGIRLAHAHGLDPVNGTVKKPAARKVAAKKPAARKVAAKPARKAAPTTTARRARR